MTEQAVQLIITLKVKENDVSIERPINIMNLEKDICALGAAEGNVEKLVRQRMRGRGCCWLIAKVTAMLAVLPHNKALSEHVFEYHSTTKKEPCRNNIKETQGTGYRPVSGSLSFLKQRKNSEMWVELLKANLNSNLLLNEFLSIIGKRETVTIDQLIINLILLIID